ncbi:MAG: hypothetical protein RBT84_12775, partial [FCB group bacterium]|nr:hypothetical protein [FCB group bacterium]
RPKQPEKQQYGKRKLDQNTYGFFLHVILTRTKRNGPGPHCGSTGGNCIMHIKIGARETPAWARWTQVLRIVAG